MHGQAEGGDKQVQHQRGRLGGGDKAPRGDDRKGPGKNLDEEEVAVGGKNVQAEDDGKEVARNGHLHAGAGVEHLGHGHAKLGVHEVPDEKQKVVKNLEHKPQAQAQQQLPEDGLHQVQGAPHGRVPRIDIGGQKKGEQEDEAHPDHGGQVAPGQKRIEADHPRQPDKHQNVDMARLQHRPHITKRRPC